MDELVQRFIETGVAKLQAVARVNEMDETQRAQAMDELGDVTRATSEAEAET